MVVDPRKAATVDPDFELFFRDLGEAVRLVEMDHSKGVTIEKGSRHAFVRFEPAYEDEHVRSLEAIVISIINIEPKQPTMLVP